MDEVKLALELNRVVHNECKDVPHDIGLRLLEVVKKHIGEQLNLYSVVCSHFNSMETFKFGKYKGLTYEEVRKKSPSYFTWLWFNIKEKLDKPLYDYIEANLKELKKEADSEHAAFMYDYCNGEVAPEY